jgi:hypothetical protein
MRGASSQGGTLMSFGAFVLQPAGALAAGILALIVPRLRIAATIYLILLGIAGLWPYLLREPWLHRLR